MKPTSANSMPAHTGTGFGHDDMHLLAPAVPMTVNRLLRFQMWCETVQ
jgi:hypothetical protein